MPKKNGKGKGKKAGRFRIRKAAGRAARKAKGASAMKPKPRLGKKGKGKEQKRYETEGVYEETIIMCPGCGRETKVIKLSGISTEGMLCQRCAKGEVEIEDMDF